jgi:hypothetical protein
MPVTEALKGLTRRQLEELQEQIERELRACVVCGVEGATPFKVTGRISGTNNSMKASMLFCKPCVERYRLPDGRAEGEPTS